MSPEPQPAAPALEAARQCAEHPETAAGYQCCECGRTLCQRCVNVGSHLIVCRVCGERAVELEPIEQAVRPRTPFERRTQRASEARPERPLDVPGLWLINHVVMPVATIAMVSALLFFLLDLRSISFGGSQTLKWVGFWFVTATVLIARYSHMTQDKERQGCYTVALTAATIAVMTVAPWESPPDGPAGPLVNVVIVLGIWRFASRLVAALSLEGQSVASKPRLYGTERQQLEAWRKAQGHSAPSEDRSEPIELMTRRNPYARPNSAIIRLAALGLVIFAVGEPFLLNGPPAIGERALAAMIVFLFATGLVLACGAAIDTLQRVRKLRGEVSLAKLPGRTLAAALVMVMVLAVALAMPGLEYQGTEATRQQGNSSADGSGDQGRGHGNDQEDASSGDSRHSDDATSSGDGQGSRESEQGRHSGDPESGSQQTQSSDAQPSEAGDSTPAPSLSGGLISSLAELGQWLRWPFYLAVAVLALMGLWRLRSQLGRIVKGWVDRLQGLLTRLGNGLRGLFRRRKTADSSQAVDPFQGLDALRGQPPHDAILDAYARLLLAFDQLGLPRRDRHTPYEFLATLPTRLRPLAEPARQLTHHYVRAAYSQNPVDDADRAASIIALEQLRDEIARQKTRQLG